MIKKNKESAKLWYSIDEKDFIDEDQNIVDEDIGSYDKSAMLYYMQNVNLMRYLPRLADSLTPVARRGLYTLYLMKSFPGTKTKKSSVVVGNTMTYHPHGDGSIYGTLVALSQSFVNQVPLVNGKGNFGNDEYPKGYAAMRYTEMTMSKYAQDCFFSDFDWDCIEKLFNTAKDDNEPLVLPCKYPNILVNGGFGIATGNAYCIPIYNIKDIVRITKKLLKDPNSDDIYILPDSPTGCDIVDNGLLRQICDTGKGSLKMRATITVEESPKKNNWIIRVHNLPWMTEINSITDALVKLTKDGKLPIKDIEDHTYPITVKNANGVIETRTQVQYDIIINRALDPYQVIDKLYKMTQLEKSILVDFKVVSDALKVDRLNMRDMINIWIDIRREYKRRLVNKTISKLSARVSLLEILTRLTEGDNYLKTMKIIRNNNASDAAAALMRNKDIPINSYQASQIVKQGLLIFSKDAHGNYTKELKEKKAQLKFQLNRAKNMQFIDAEISEELDELLKYATDRKSKIVSMETSVEIPDTDHFVTITKLGMIKKLLYNPSIMQKKKTPSLGAFKNQDYPLHGFIVNNHDSVMMFDNFGRYSVIPVHQIENTDPSQYGTSVYDTTKLNGEVVSASEFVGEDLQSFVKSEVESDIVVMTLTKNGFLKKTPIEEFTKTRNQKNVRAMKIKDDDQMVDGQYILEKVINRGKKSETRVGANVLIYTEKGYFSYVRSDQIASQMKDAGGLLSINLLPDDACKGMCVIGSNDTHLLIVTEKGCMKKCELSYLGEPGKRKVTSYLATLDPSDKVNYVNSIADTSDITICTRTSYDVIPAEDIPVKSRKAKCKKMIPVQLGNNIISVGVSNRK